MKYLVNAGQMKEIDRYTIEEIGVPSLVLMERAALAVAEKVKEHGGKDKRIWAACGMGNNGADGIAAARMLYLSGYKVTVILTGKRESATKEWQVQYEIGENIGLPMIEFKDFLPGRCDIIIDALFGVGLTRRVEGEYRECLEMLRQAEGAYIVAVDMPSGIHSDTGKVMGISLKADDTVTFGWKKKGLAVYPGREYGGRVTVADIGFPGKSFQQIPDINTIYYEEEDLRLVPERAAYSNKGTFGKVLVIAGSKHMGGAAYLSALSAYRMGAGLVKVMTVEENRQFLLERLPEAVLSTYRAEQIEEDREEFGRFIEKQCAAADVIVLGPGLGQEDYVPALVEEVLSNAYVPIVLDADGLNAVAAHPRLTSYYTENIIITPHLGEMSRLTQKTIEEIKDDLTGTAEQYAKDRGITCVLKDAATVCARRDGKTYINSSGNSGMAKAGSGDVLTGIIAGLLALGLEEPDSASLGVYLHGLAGDEARRLHGEHSILAGDIADALPAVLKRIRQK